MLTLLCKYQFHVALDA